MSVKTENISTEDIKETKFFQSLGNIVQRLTLRRVNVNSIQHGVNVSLNIGFEKWNQQTADRWTNRQIVKELITKIEKNEN